MRKRFVISESEATKIRKIYGLINEQQDVRCDEWKDGTFVQGDGVTTPKITITKNPTLIEGLYEGPDKGGCIQRSKFNDRDTPHQLAGITVFYEASPYLKELYNNGVYVRPDTTNITMERVLNKKFKISIPLLPTTEDKAVTSINERGGMGHQGDLTEIQNIESDPNNIFVKKQKVTAGDMTETFISFRNIKNFPILSKQSSPSTQTTTVTKTTTGTKHGYREILPDGNTRVWDGPNNKWLPDADWMKLYNFDGTPKKVETTTTQSPTIPKSTGYTLEPDKRANRFTKF